MRLIGGVLTRWPWILACALLFAAGGALVGMKLTKASFALTVSLIKRRVPQTVQTSESGKAFRPVDLNDATLLATLLATEPLDLALKKARNGIDPGRIRKMVEAAQSEGTDIFFITYHSPISPQDAVDFTTIWADEINNYTQRLQQTEAHEVRLILQKEVADLEKQLVNTNQEILNFSKQKDYLGGEAQVSAELAKLSQIEIQLESTRTALAAKEEQMKLLTEQIEKQGPLEAQLRAAKDELAILRATYTDVNPLVQTKLETIDYLNEQIKLLSEKEKTEDDLDSYTGTPLGNQLYFSIIQLRNDVYATKNQIQSFEKLYAATAARIGEFPAIVSAYDEMQKRRNSIAQSLTIMNNRLKEAEIFASGAPGYWQVFQAADPRRIVPSSMVAKPAMLGIAAGVMGAGLAVILTILLSHRTRRRSVLECCAAAQAPLVVCVPDTADENARLAIEHFWITHLGPRLGSYRRILFWTAAVKPEEERDFWTMLAAAAHADTGRTIQVQDLSPDALWSEARRPDVLEWFSHIPSQQPAPADFPFPPLAQNVLKTSPLPNANNEPVAATLLRAGSLPQGEAREMLARVDYWLTLVAGQKEALQTAVRNRPLTAAYLQPSDGTIAWIERPTGFIRRGADSISLFLAKRFS